MTKIVLEAKRITDWASFHAQCRAAFGFPEFYGANMNASIDCLTYLYDGDGMSRFVLQPGETLRIEVRGSSKLRRRHPDIVQALVECTAAVNERYRSRGQPPALQLELL